MILSSASLLAIFAAALLLAAACATPSAPPAPAKEAPAAARPTTADGAPPSAPAGAARDAAPPPSPMTVRMAVLGILAESGVYIALERGYFAEAGITPEFATIDTGARAIPLVATGQVDVTGGGFSPSYINAALRGVGMKIVAGMSRNEPDGNSGFTMVRKDLVESGQVRDWPDLKGRVLAVPGRGSVNDYSVARGLQSGGLSIADLEVVEMSYPDMIPAFANTNIEVGYMTEPIATLAVERNVAVKWRPTGEHIPGIQPALISYGPTFLAEQQEAGRRWMTAYLRGARDYTAAFRRGEGRADVVAILTRHTTVKDPALYDRIGMSTIDPNGAVNLASLTDQAAWYAELGLLQGNIDVASLVDTRFTDAALARLGPYQP